MGNKEILLYDAGGDGITEGCPHGGTNCPKLIYDKKTDIVSLIDINGNKASMTLNELYKFINANNIIVNKLKELKRINE